MSPSFHRVMTEATRLTHAGDLMRATAVIQAALRGSELPGTDADKGDVIDVDAREVEPERDLLVLREIEAQGQFGRERDVGTEPAPRLRPVPSAGEFIGSTYACTAGTREYKLYVPPSYRGQALPLVVMLHGCTQDPDDFAAGTRMNELALERNFLVLYPAQAQRANAQRCWSWFKQSHQRRDRGEPALLAGMTRDVIDRYNVDSRRVYVAGLSAGGAMAAILGDAYPDLFAAVGVHSGLPPGSAKDLRSAFAAMHAGTVRAATKGDAARATPIGPTPPTIVFHGDMDTTVHPTNGEHVVAASAGGAAPERERARRENGREYTRRVWRDHAGRVVAEHWAVHGSGHAWSGGSARGSFTDAKGPDATREMLRFFFAHRLTAVGCTEHG